MLLSGDFELYKIFYEIQAYLNNRFIRYKWGKKIFLR